MTFGVVSTGFNKKLLQDIIGEIETDERALISASLNLLPSSVLGQLNGIFGDKIREMWDVAESVYNSFDPDLSSSSALDSISAITGAIRLSATRSTCVLNVVLDPGTTLTIGRRVRDPVTGIAFETTQQVSNSGLIQSSFFCAAQSIDFGPIAAPANTLTEIMTPVSGWVSVTNDVDSTPGSYVETDHEFRIRREELLRISGAATLEAIRSALRNLDNVTQAILFENTTMVVDINGLPGKSFECIVGGGTASTGSTANPGIIETIFLTKPVGIESHGFFSGIVKDSQGVNHTIKYSRPTELLLWFQVFVDINPLIYPLDGNDQIKDALVAFCQDLLIGDDVIYNRSASIPFDVVGVVDVSQFYMNAQPDNITTANFENYNIQVGDTLTLFVSSENEQLITFTTGFTVGAATAEEVAAVISAQASNATATSPGGNKVTITSNDGGSMHVSGGTANAVLAFPTTLDPTGTTNIILALRELASGDTSRVFVTSTPVTP